MRLHPSLITIRPDGSFELHRRTFAHDDLKYIAVIVVDMQYRRLCIATLRNENV